MKATSQLQTESGWARVTAWHFPPGSRTGLHVHAHKFVVIALSTGTLELDDGTRREQVQLVSGTAYLRPPGVEHDVINPNEFEFRLLEVELLGA
jgi:mannose-6-phosphate isomerase-like protein (cupin superfamily)